MANLTCSLHDGASTHLLAKATRDRRASDDVASRWLCPTQVWTFSGEGVEGDCCITPSKDTFGQSSCVAVVRFGNTTQVLEGSPFKTIVEAFGHTIGEITG